MEERLCSTSTPSLNREDSSSSARSRPEVPPLTGLVLYSSQRIISNTKAASRPPNLRNSSSTSFLRRADSTSVMRCAAYYHNTTPLCNGTFESSNSASYPSINKIHFSSLSSSPRDHRSPGGSNPVTASGSPVPHSGTPGRAGCHRTRLAMLGQVKGYLENFKSSVDSIKDEV